MNCFCNEKDQRPLSMLHAENTNTEASSSTIGNLFSVFKALTFMC